MEWMYDNDFDSFSLEIGEYLLSRDILLTDITEAIFMVKSRREDPDEEAKVTLTLGSGLEKVPGETEAEATLKATFNLGDFGTSSMEVGPRYYFGLGIKISGLGKFLELVPTDNNLRIVSDFIHD